MLDFAQSPRSLNQRRRQTRSKTARRYAWILICILIFMLSVALRQEPDLNPIAPGTVNTLLSTVRDALPAEVASAFGFYQSLAVPDSP